MLSGKRRSGRGRWAARARRVPNAALLGQQTVPLLLLGASPIHPRRPAAPAHGRGHAHCRAASPASCARRGGHRTPPPGGRCRRRRAHTPYLGPRRPAAATARLDGPPRDTHALPTHHPNIRQVDQAEVKAIKHITTARYKAEQFDDGLAGGRFREGDVWGWLMVVVGEQQGGAGGGKGAPPAAEAGTAGPHHQDGMAGGDGEEGGQPPLATLHLLGLLSDGGVHAVMDHVWTLLDAAVADGVRRIRLHVLTDERDVGERTALG